MKRDGSSSVDHVEQAKQSLTQGLAALQSGDDWKRALKAMAIRGAFSVARYSFRNQLILATMGAGEYVGTYQAWTEAGRQVRKGERAKYVLAPRPYVRAVTKTSESGETTTEERHGLTFRAMAVFGMEQTDGEELPASPCTKIEGDDLSSLIAVVRDAAIELSGGFLTSVEIRERRIGDHPGAGGWVTLGSGELVVLTTDRSQNQQFRTLVHEVAHAILHGNEDHHSRPEREVEAESVSYVVCHALGLDTQGYAFPYVASWAGKQDAAALVLASGERISKASRAILEAIEAATAPDLECGDRIAA